MKILVTASTAGHLRAFHGPYLRALTERGHAVHAAAGGDGAGVAAEKYFALPFEKRLGSPANLRAAGELARIIKEERYGLILTHTTLAAFFTRLAARGARTDARLINTVHGYLFDDGSPAPRRLAYLGAEKLVSAETDGIITMNKWDSDCARRHGLSRGGVELVPGMGVPLTRFSPATEAERAVLRRELGIPADAFVCVCAAEFSKRKAQASLLRAVSGAPEGLWLVLPGEGALKKECMALAASLGMAGRTVFPGHVADVERYLRASDVYVSASRTEGLPFAVVEGMACGLPAVLTEVKGHADILSAGGCGLLWPCGDENACRLRLLSLYNDRAALARMGAAARVRALDFSLESAFPAYMAALERLAADAGAPIGN